MSCESISVTFFGIHIIPKTFYLTFAVKYASENCYQLGFPRNVRCFICNYRQIRGSVNLFYYFFMTIQSSRSFCISFEVSLNIAAFLCVRLRLYQAQQKN
ncbi:unnamed protein product [Acanthoscelides obtectus]|uniref:Uncharacterized protein n=1 Tax=Acanthoscelides obtectus TaxID=200917 RepID=A0A9P0MBG0_ACAOB|nr:unnamed protein product [Acanthoscelides obtectus]CAK1665450.1 hypothetical protein AOBTE_LOCUS24824 [Acanthoscelides obtectus]